MDEKQGNDRSEPSPTDSSSPTGHDLLHPAAHQRHWEHTLQGAQEWFNQHAPHARRKKRRSSLILHRMQTGKRWWKFTLRPWDDDEYQDWWFAGTAIPLLAATIGPLANVFSIAALVTYWRMCVVEAVSDYAAAAKCVWDGNPNSLVLDLNGHYYPDPSWCIHLNIVSLVAGVVGNFFLLCNFTGRIRYIIALPVTILMWYVATGILIGIVSAMATQVAPHSPQQIYSEGFWYAVLAAVLYFISSMMLMINMLGYFLGHYPQHFNLTDSQRTLILQSILFFVWLAGGAAVFSTVESAYGTDPSQNWSYVNALYFCDVTILTVGFGDLYTTSNLGRGLLFPYAIGGIIMLGLMVSSIAKFASEIGSTNIVRKHTEISRAKTAGRTITTSLDLDRDRAPTFATDAFPTISAPSNPHDRSRDTAIAFADDSAQPAPRENLTLRKVASLVTKAPGQRKPKLLILREERDRFNAMRHIQMNTAKFKNWYALGASITAFGILWCVGAVVFWRAERVIQGMTYFEALYFCYVSLLTIGYGDFAPQSNVGRPFFVLWSLIAVPTMTILISDLGATVINKFKHGTFRVADFTLLPRYGVWREWLDKHHRFRRWLLERKQAKEERKRLEAGFQVGPELELRESRGPTIEDLAAKEPTRPQLAKKLTTKIRQVAEEMKREPNKRYSYEEWVEFTRLIRFTARHDEHGMILRGTTEEEEEDLIEWDWIGEDSPLLAKVGEPEFVLDRLCESMHRLIRAVAKVQAEEAEGKEGKMPVRPVGGRPQNVEDDDDEDDDDDDDDGGLERRSLGYTTDRDSMDGVDPLDVRQCRRATTAEGPSSLPSTASSSGG